MLASPRKLTLASHLVVIGAVISAVFAGGCKSTEVPPEPISPPDLEIVSAGNEPRQLLRYKAPTGTTQQLELTLAIELTAGEVGTPMPTIALTLTYVVDAVMPSGQRTLRGTIDSVRALDTEGSKVPATALNGPLATLRGLTIRSVLSANGRITGSTLDKGSNTIAPELEAQLQSLVRSFESTMMPLPDEPVGVGAVWRNSRSVEQNGMKLKAVNSVSLTAIKGDVLEYAIDTDIHGTDQTVVQEGVSIEVKDIVGNGGGRGTIDLAKLAVTSELAAELRARMNAPGDPEPTKMEMATLQKVRPRQGAHSAP